MCDTALTTVGELAARAARVSGRLLLCQLTGPDAHAGRLAGTMAEVRSLAP